jgi:diguanylate cyclase (GGDEF)-like protein
MALTIKSREAILVAAGCLGLAGAVLTSFDLFQAMRRAEDLYSVGMAGLSIEGDLQDYTQESRRLFVYALTTGDPNVQLTYVRAARAADREVGRLHKSFAGLRLSGPAQATLAQLVRDWKNYLVVRDDLIGLILEDQTDLALKEELQKGAPLFEQCARRMQELKQLLDQYAREQLMAVRRTYYRCAAEVGMLIVAMILFIGSLRILSSLKRRNQALAEKEIVERQRSSILESISQNAPLAQIFPAIEHLLSRQFPQSKVSIGLSDSAITPPSDAPGQLCSVRLLTAQQQLAGTLDVRFPHHGQLSEHDVRFIERAAQLAVLAIEHRHATDQLAYQAQHCSLTGLANRMKFQDQLRQAVARAVTEKHELAVLWIDLDRFKQVNDVLGHHVGDTLLQQVALRLSGCALQHEGSAAARIGGDEFVILLPACPAERAVEIATQILARLDQPVVTPKHDLGVSASIGISLFPEHGTDAETLMRNADTAMYAAKFLGKSRYEIYDPAQGRTSGETFEIDRLLRTALQEGEFELHYQPQVGTRGIECVEALLRWHSPALGAVPPSRFIPIAEENGVIVPLGQWVLRQACFQAARWNREYGPLRAAVNVSAHQFVRSDFVAVVLEALADSGLEATLLELELTETTLMSNLEQAAAQFHNLRRIGVRIAIDDFGTGNSSLSYLRKLPVDTLKIDRSFMQDLDVTSGESSSRQMIRAIVGMAHGLDLSVVAEGVERTLHYQVIMSEACDLSQGYLHYKPMSAQMLEKALAAERGEEFRADLLRLSMQAAEQQSARQVPG